MAVQDLEGKRREGEGEPHPFRFQGGDGIPQDWGGWRGGARRGRGRGMKGLRHERKTRVKRERRNKAGRKKLS